MWGQLAGVRKLTSEARRKAIHVLWSWKFDRMLLGIPREGR